MHWPDGQVLCHAWSLPLVEVHDQISSTQDRLFQLANESAPAWSAVVALSQNAGRGRRGHAWESVGGLGLWISLLLPPTEAEDVPIPLRLGLLLAETVEVALHPRSGQGPPVLVKWPNDIWVSGRKVAGILAERSGGHTVAGIGLNLFHQAGDFGPALKDRATSLAIEGWSDDPVALVGQMMTHIRGRWHDPAPAVLQRLRSRDALLGRSLKGPDGRLGWGAGIDDDGALRVRGNDSEWRVLAGAVALMDAG